ncbi:ammonium transporter [Periweissella fabaria]|uniref:Ammonium transporter n=1 Tax=Periweissella fabaria TaxID=546157 RepID=A0ABM8Z6I9_9LACO|nr:ammonium transporter [Periweissella fabaria]MCM0596641.1 ammonium transporter [Periweissella fabaria]CAH0416434.1 Ammonium transporter [Periweissella fabaria]
MNTSDVVWILVSAALVWLMTPGLALFYGGLANRNFASNTVFLSIIVLGIVPLVWVILGYSLAFSGQGLIIGNLHHFLLNNLAYNHSTLNLHIPDAAFMLFQGMFAIITVAIITGSVVGRMNLKAILLFIPLWLILVYVPLAHMVWGGGILQKMGALDFAGGDVVHISSGVSGLTLAILVGRRQHFSTESSTPDNISHVLIGAALLWFGWFGFNSGSALAINETAILAFINTNIAAAAALTTWFVIDFVKTGKARISAALSGGLVGLVVITPAAGFVTPTSAILMGIIAVPIVYFLVDYLKTKFQYDDTLDAFGFHGIGGIVGGLLTAIFAQKDFHGLVATGSFKQLGIQILAIILTVILAAGITWLIGKLISLIIPLRIPASVEQNGIDHELHGEYISIISSPQFSQHVRAKQNS